MPDTRLPKPPAAGPPRIAVVGPGRLGTALHAALSAAGIEVEGPLGRGEAPSAHAAAVLLCVGDGDIAAAAAALSPGPLVGHCSGATPLAPLLPHEAFSLHPLLSVTAGRPTRFAGAGAAVAGSTPRALALARDLAAALGMEAIEVPDEHRVAYHAAAAVASNFLVTLEGAAEELAVSAGVPRRLLAPLVRASVENWAQLGAARALTGPIARGDEQVAAAHRAVVAERAPARLPLFDALAQATRELAGRVPA